MSPIAHAELGWLLAVPVARDRRERIWGAVAGVLPDLDGLTLAAYPWDHGDAFARWHHLLTHGALAAAGVTLIAVIASSRGARLRTGGIALASFHLHLLCDLMGSGQGWPIAYLWPLSEHMTAPFRWGWALASWQNMAIAVGTSFAILGVGVWRGHTVVELFSARYDAVFVQVLRIWRARLRGAGAKPS